MPISKANWELLKVGKGFGVKSRAIEIFLRNNSGNAFLAKEILEELKDEWKDSQHKQTLAGISGILNNMKRNGIIEHNRPYWRIKDNDSN